MKLETLKTKPVNSIRKSTSSFIKNELFQAGLLQKETEFDYFLNLCDSLWSEFLFLYKTEKEPDKYSSIVQAGFEAIKL